MPTLARIDGAANPSADPRALTSGVVKHGWIVAQTPVEIAHNKDEVDSKNRFYSPELDSLRFFAFFIVFLCHLPPNGFSPLEPGIIRTLGIAARFGLDLFFSLSAYLITALLLREHATKGEINVGYFYVRRILRIWPLYFSYLGVGSALAYNTPWAVPPEYLCALFLFVGNFFSYPNFIVGHLWSVCLEEQFYLCLPWFVRRASRRTIVQLAMSMLLLATVARLLWAETAGIQPTMWNNTMTRLDSLAIGILIAAVPISWIRRRDIYQRAGLAAGGLLLWLWVARTCDLLSAKVTLIQLLLSYPAAALGCGALLLASLDAGAAGAHFMCNRATRYLGKISYGMYVYHSVAIVLSLMIMFHVDPRDNNDMWHNVDRQYEWLFRYPWPLGTGWAIHFAISFSITLILAALSYRWLESPFLRFKERFARIPSRPV